MSERQLDTRVFPFTVTIPAQTSSTFPLSTPLTIDPGVMDSIELQVPSGHVGLTGFSLVLAGTTLFPWGSVGAFVVAENAIIRAGLGIEVGGGLAVLAYNDDFYNHSFFFRITLADLPAVTVIPFDARPGVAAGAGYTGMLLAPLPSPQALG